MKIFVTGINGFIGSHLLESIIAETDWRVVGFDLSSSNIAAFMDSDRLEFRRGDIFNENEWLEEQVRSCDVVLPLVGIAKPAYYLKRPLLTYELDFEQNLKIVRMCAQHGKRLIFPSTSEVYGMSDSNVLSEDESVLITGPICKMRWIYSCSKQMMDRLIFAYKQERGLRFSIFRPFNWVGPRLDSFADAEARTARSITQMIYDVLHRGQIIAVDGGKNRRSFIWIGDAMGGLMALIADDGRSSDGEIFNIGNPGNNCSIKELAEMIIDVMKEFPQFRGRAERAVIADVAAVDYYGKSYEDLKNRVPSIVKMENLLGWSPRTGMRELVAKTLAYYAELEDAKVD